MASSWREAAWPPCCFHRMALGSRNMHLNGRGHRHRMVELVGACAPLLDQGSQSRGAECNTDQGWI